MSAGVILTRTVNGIKTYLTAKPSISIIPPNNTNPYVDFPYSGTDFGYTSTFTISHQK